MRGGLYAYFVYILRHWFWLIAREILNEFFCLPKFIVIQDIDRNFFDVTNGMNLVIDKNIF